MRNKNEGNKNKIILEDFNCTTDNMGRDGEKKTNKHLIDVFPIIPCQNSSWIIGLKIYGEGRAQILLGSSATIGPLARIRHRQGLH